MSAVALNHKDLFIRQRLYPSLDASKPMFSDGCGTVVEVGSGVASPAAWKDQPVLFTPCRGWEADPAGPEDFDRTWATTGSSSRSEFGTAQEWLVVEADEAVPCPAHLSTTEGAALPLVGLTGWRALVTKSGNALPGRNILVTGVGGGVAIQVVQFAVALGCAVFVTSGDQAKLDRAVQEFGARGGVSYKDADWGKKLAALLPSDRPYLDAVIDGAGGDIVSKTARMLKAGGVIVQYGMTLAPKMEWSMPAVLKNIELKGSTMGSRKEFKEMMAFVAEKKIRPVVSRVVKGLGNLEGIESLFEDIKAGRQFGKLVIQIDVSDDSPSKL